MIRLLIVSGALFAAILVCELALRARSWFKYGQATTSSIDESKVLDPVTGLRIPRPGYSIKAKNIDIHINSLGFRGEEIALEKPANAIRIACLGASTTYCAEVDNQSTWPHQLQIRLQKRYPQAIIQVVNAGVAGFTAAECRKNLRRVLPLSPDIVMYYEVNNQMAKDSRLLAMEKGLIQQGGSNISPFVRFLSNQSLLFDLGYKNWKILSAQRGTDVRRLDGLSPRITEACIEEIDQIHKELRDRQIQFVLTTFIVKYRRDQNRTVQLANADVAFYYMPWMSIEDLLDSMDYYNQALLDYGRQNGIPVVDDRDCIPPDAKHFADCMHLTAAGCDRMAERFLKFFEESACIDRLLDSKTRSAAP